MTPLGSGLKRSSLKRFRLNPWLLLALVGLLLSGCRNQEGGVACPVDGQTIWLHPDGTFAQNFTYSGRSLNPTDPNTTITSGVNTGTWQLVLPASGPSDGSAYLLVQGFIPSGTAPRPNVTGDNSENKVSRRLLLSDIPDLKNVLSPAQFRDLAASSTRPAAPPAAPVIKIGPTTSP